MPRLRRNALDLLAGITRQLETPQVAERLKHPTNTIRRALEDLAAYGIVDRESGHVDNWSLSEWGRGMYAKCQLVPEIRGGICTPHSLITSNTPTDRISGTTLCEWEAAADD